MKSWFFFLKIILIVMDLQVHFTGCDNELRIFILRIFRNLLTYQIHWIHPIIVVVDLSSKVSS